MRAITTVVAALAGVLGLSSAASAMTVDLIWAGSGTDITPAVGSATASSVVTLGVYAVITTPPGMDGITVSVSYDPYALSVASCTIANRLVGQYVAGGYFQPLLGKAATCNTANVGIAGQMDQQAAFGYLPSRTGPGWLQIATIVFHVHGGTGNTVVQSFFNPLYDGWGTNNHVFSLDATFGSATVRMVPEPTTAVLVGAGFLGLVAAGRRRRQD